MHIYEEFQYLVTISNSGGSVNNAVFSQIINDNTTILSYVSQNPIGGATLITDFTITNNIINGIINNFPSGSSIEIKVIVKAPDFLGGIATSTTITPPINTSDTNTSNNTSIISIDVTDVLIDFTVTHAQISPPEGAPINAWNDTVTYQITITPINISSAIELIFNFNTVHEFTSNGSLTFEMVYQYLDPECALIIEPIEVLSHIIIELSHDNISSNTSNSVLTQLIEAELCGDITFANAGQYWVSNIFNMPVGEVLTIRSVIIFIESECAIDVVFENELDVSFNIVGSPICQITFGNA